MQEGCKKYFLGILRSYSPTIFLHPIPIQEIKYHGYDQGAIKLELNNLKAFNQIWIKRRV